MKSMIRSNRRIRNSYDYSYLPEPIRLAGFIEDSIVDGPGVRFVVFTQGCPHNCLGCHNPQSHDYNGGFVTDVYKLAEKIIKSKAAKSSLKLTFSGGEPFLQAKALAKVARLVREFKEREFKEKEVEIITYTGYTLEQLLQIEKNNNDLGVGELLTQSDFLVDGKFDINKKSSDWFYRGSTNQRIWDITCYPNCDKFRLIERREDLYVLNNNIMCAL